MNEWRNWLLSVLTLLLGAGGGWMLDKKKHRQEVESLKADNRQKDLNLSKDYVESFRKEIADPLRREVGGLRREVKYLRDAIQKINDCPHAADCPVYDELQKQQNDVGTEDNGTAN